MVSLRALRQQQEEAERRDRLVSSRRLASQLGVDAARRYEVQKRHQLSMVRDALHDAWVEQQRERHVMLEGIIREGELRQGEGMRNAAALAAHTLQTCREELGAWDAEHQLEAERYKLAAERERLLREQRTLQSAAAAERRAAVKDQEARRSKLVVSRASSANSSMLLTTNVVNRSLPSMSKISISVNSDVGSVFQGVSGSAAAKSLAEARKTAEELRQEKFEREQQRAAQRARQVVKEMKKAEEQRRLDMEQEELLKQSMAANAMRSALRPVSATDFQEQEARKAASVVKRSEADFEAQFLRGAWSADSIQRFHDALQDPDVNSVPLLQAAEVEALCGPGVALGVRHVSVVDATECEPDCEDVPKTPEHRPLDANESLEIDPRPQSSVSLPQPTPKTPSPPQHEEIEEEHVEAVPPQQAPVAESDAKPFSPLRHRQEQFLKDLEALQQRLAAATNSTATTRRGDLDISNGSAAMTAEGDMSISSMSSQELSTRVVCSEDTSTDSVPVKRNRPSLGMSAEQMRESLRRMTKQWKGCDKK